MTESPESPQSGTAPTAAKRRGGGLAGMLLADLKSMAGGLGVQGAGSMKKAQLIDAIKAAQSGGSSSGAPAASSGAQPDASTADPARGRTRRGQTAGGDRPEGGGASSSAPAPEQPEPREGERDAGRVGGRSGNQGGGQGVNQGVNQGGGQPSRGQGGQGGQGKSQKDQSRGRDDQGKQGDQPKGQGDQGKQGDQGTQGDQPKGQGDQGKQGGQGKPEGGQSGNNQSGNNQSGNNQSGNNQSGNNQSGNNQSGNNQSGNNQSGGDQGEDDDGEGGSRRNRRRRGRDRTRTTAGANNGSGNTGRNEPDTTVLDDDVLVPAAGILDVLDNYAFVRTSGYLPGVDDVYLSLSMVRKFGLRRGDAVVGQVRQPREGERKEKFNPMVRIDSVNGADPETARTRSEFAELTPVHPDQRLRLETGPGELLGRAVDLAAPIGKGQRALIVSPAHAGKTTLLRTIADAVTRNNPECHLMVVLVDERPEEVTDFQRSVKGEVVASTFDRPPADHTIVAELAIERAKRLVELGHDVVVLLDGLTRLGRAYNLAAPAGGRALAGGIDANALYPPKRFFGAARNLEDSGSLTIVATAAVDTGSALDEVILDELGDTANAEIRLRRDLVETGVFPTVDLVRSATRQVDRLVGDQELAILDKLRRVLARLDERAAGELLRDRLGASQTNVELLTRVQRAAPEAV